MLTKIRRDEPFDLVIFDCDGVLVDSEVLAAECLAQLLSRNGVPTSASDVFARFLGSSFRVVEEAFRRTTGNALPKGFEAEFLTELEGSIAASLKPIRGIESVLAGLTVPCCVASSSNPQRIICSLAVTGLDRYRMRVFDASMVTRGKPAPDLFLHAAESMGAVPGRVLVIEDSVAGVVAAKSAGMTAWGFTGGSHYAQRDGGRLLGQAGADRVFSEMGSFVLN
ncbi:MAG: HAD family hydrolase [Pseudomonadota bacterium]|nr:HAD family hydrolase [Pseudomonadota bacterium]